jgi:hypothetical protein
VLAALDRHAAKRRLAMTEFIGKSQLFLVRSEATKQSRGAARAFVRWPWIASPQARLAMTGLLAAVIRAVASHPCCELATPTH